MTRLIMTRGLPASGKSTWAEGEVLAARPGAIVRINKDLLREMLHAGRHQGRTEKQILAARDALAASNLAAGVDVIVDDTNLNPFHEERLRELAADRGAVFEVKDFTDVPLDECIRRDLRRVRSVGETVIRQMFDEWLRPAPTTPPPAPHDASRAVLVDVDGTVALMRTRGPFDWHAVATDEPNLPVIAVVRALADAGHRIVFMSGRDGVCRDETAAWLNEHVTADFDLHMRAPGDNRKDAIVKRELFDTHIAGRFHVVAVLDDRDQVVRMWRDELGLTCMQVAPGAF